MSADLYIHAIDNGVTVDDVKLFSCNALGSKYFTGFGAPQPSRHDSEELLERIARTPQIWVGEVSWLKAALCDDAGTYIPDVVDHVQTVVGEDFPQVTEELIAALRTGFVLPNTTNYSTGDWEKIEAFLREHMGKQLFIVSW